MTPESASSWAEGLYNDLVTQGPEREIPTDVTMRVQKLIKKLQESVVEVPMKRIEVLAMAGMLLKTVELYFPFNSPFWAVLVQLGVKLGEEMKKEGMTESEIEKEMKKIMNAML
jgi:hypothetical protein